MRSRFEFPFHERKVADEQSWNATSRLFNWHRQHDDGLWLHDGITTDVEVIRRLQQHPWIVDPFGTSGQSDLPVDCTLAEGDRERILEWTAEVARYQASMATIT